MTDEEKIVRLNEENQKLAEELAQAQKETIEIESEIEKITLQNNSMGNDRKQ